MSAHTPGPWEQGGGSEGYCIIAANGTHVVCFGHDYDEYGHVSEADGRLIAAAPDLLAAVKALRDGAFGNPQFPEAEDAVEAMADAAIAKAEGR